MIQDTISKKYAKALLELGQENGQEERYGRDQGAGKHLLSPMVSEVGRNVYRSEGSSFCDKITRQRRCGKRFVGRESRTRKAPDG